MEILLDYLDRFNVITKILLSERGRRDRGEDVMIEAEVKVMSLLALQEKQRHETGNSGSP